MPTSISMPVLGEGLIFIWSSESREREKAVDTAFTLDWEIAKFSGSSLSIHPKLASEECVKPPKQMPFSCNIDSSTLIHSQKSYRGSKLGRSLPLALGCEDTFP